MSIAAIVLIIQNALAILAYFFNPEVRKKRDRQKDWARFKELEREFRTALAEGDPARASQAAKAMEEIRKEYTFVNKKT